MNKNRTKKREKNNLYTTFGEKNKIKAIGRLRAQPIEDHNIQGDSIMSFISLSLLIYRIMSG